MCKYKMLKYNESDDFYGSQLLGKKDEESLVRKDEQKNASVTDRWIKIDWELQNAIKDYYELKSDVNGE